MSELGKGLSLNYVSNSLLRGIFVNLSFIFVNSSFVATVGGKSYSKLFFFGAILTAICYGLFLWASEKITMYVYFGIILFVGLISVLQFSYVDSHLLLYIFGVTIVVMDLVGTTVSASMLQSGVGPFVFQDIYQKMISAELVSRIAAAATVWGLGQMGDLQGYYPIAWLALLGHLVTFTGTSRSVGSLREKRFSWQQRKEDIISAMGFVKSNHLIRLAIVVMVWTYVTKFVVEYLFYQVVGERFVDSDRIGSFVAMTTMTVVVGSLLFQKYFGSRLIGRKPLSFLLSILPVGVVLIGGAALFVPAFAPVVLLMIFFQICNRSFQLPVSRQCLVPVPQDKRHHVIYMISILMTVGTIMVSGGLTLLNQFMGVQQFVWLVLALAVVSLFFIADIDTYYTRNLWSYFKEKQLGQWKEVDWHSNPLSIPQNRYEEVKTYVKDDGLLDDGEGIVKGELLMRGKEAAQVGSIMKVLSDSYDPYKLNSAIVAHGKLLKSENTTEVIAGLKLVADSFFPHNKRVMEIMAKHPKAQVAQLAKDYLKTEQVCEQLEMRRLRGVTRRRIRELVLRMVQEGRQDDLAKLKRLLLHSDRIAVSKVIRNLSAGVEGAPILWDCLDSKHGWDIEPLINYMYDLPYRQADDYRRLIYPLNWRINRMKARLMVRKTCLELYKQNFSIWSVKHSSSNELKRFAHALFLEEWLLSRKTAAKYADTIGSLVDGKPGERQLLSDIHLQVLKGSHLSDLWAVFMMEDVPQWRRQRAHKIFKQVRGQTA